MPGNKPLLIVGMRDDAINKTFGPLFHVVIPGQPFAHLNFTTAFAATTPREVEQNWWKAVELQAKDGKVHWLF